MPANKRQTRAASASESTSDAQNAMFAYIMPMNASQNHANANASRDSHNDEQPTTQERIGDVLRRQRERHFGNLQEIAEYLCIKPGFLTALENSRYNEIPADAYVIGFLRTYAEFLGIDGKEAIDRYRKEMAGRRRKPTLIMPIPIGEGRAPSAMLVAGAAVVALLVYVAWYGVSTSDRATITTPPVIAATQTTPESATALAATSNLSLQQQNPLSTNAITPAGVLLSQDSTNAPVSATTNDLGALQSGITVSGSAPASAGAVAPTPETTTEPAQTIASATPSVQQQTQPSTTPSAKTDKQTDKIDFAVAESKPASRVTIRAEQTSWVLIADSRGKTVYDKVLKPGDTYAIPDQPGLKMTTGNSGGLALVIDGTETVRLPGNSSRIMRNIALEPAHLKAQRASSGTQD
ncbi:MAG: RodZ domain-containing protein [Bdellovibrionales bacterium]